MRNENIAPEGRQDVVRRWRQARGHQTQQDFIKSLGIAISPRTLRSWAKKTPDPEQPPVGAVRHAVRQLLDVVDGVRAQLLALQEGLEEAPAAGGEDRPEGKPCAGVAGDNPSDAAAVQDRPTEPAGGAPDPPMVNANSGMPPRKVTTPFDFEAEYRSFTGT